MKKIKLLALLLVSVLSVNLWGADYFTDNLAASGSNSVSSRTGWTSLSNIYAHYGSAIRLGTSSKSGSITKTAMTDIGKTPINIKVSFAAAKWSSDATGLKITVNNAGKIDGSTTYTISKDDLRGETSTQGAFTFQDDDYFEVTITGATSSTTIKFETTASKRVLLGNVKISPAPTKSDVTLTPTQASRTVNVNDVVEDLSSWFTISPDNYDGTISYKSSNEDVFAVDEGAGYAFSEGSCNLIIKAPETDKFKAANCTIPVIVEAACTNSITIKKGTETNGTFNLDNEGEVCINEGSASVTVTASPKNMYYRLASVTSVGDGGVTVGTIGDISDNKCTITGIDKNTTITAIFAPIDDYTITLNAGNGSVTDATWTAGTDVWTKTSNQAITLPSATPSAACEAQGWTFVGWSKDNQVNTTTEPTLVAVGATTPATNTNYYAVYREGGAPSNTFTKITSEADFTSGDYMVVSNGSYSNYAMGNSVTDSRMAETSKTISNNVITNTDGTYIWTLIKLNGKVAFYNAAANKYLSITDEGVVSVGAGPQSFSYSYNTTDSRWEFTSPSSHEYNQLVYSTYFKAYNDQSTAINLYKRGTALADNWQTNPSCSSYTLSTVADVADGGVIYTTAASLQEGGVAFATYSVNEEYNFTGWSISGTGASIDDENAAVVKVTMGSGDATLTANFAAKQYVNVTFKNNDNELSSLTKSVEIGTAIGELPILTSDVAEDARSKTFVGWTEDKVEVWQSNKPTLIDASTIINEAKTYNAVWAKGGTSYDRVTDVNQLADGQNIIIQDDSHLLLNTIGKGSVLTETDNKVTPTNDNQIWKLVKDEDDWVFVGANNKKVFVTDYTDDLTFTSDGSTEYYYWTIKESTHSSDYFWIYLEGESKDYYWEYNNKWTTYGINNTGWPSSTQDGYMKMRLYISSLTDYITHSSASPLASITLNTTGVKTNYFVGESFTSEGLTAMATLEDETITFQIDPNDLIITPADLSTDGTKEVTVSYTFNGATKSATYDVNAYSVTINSVYTDRVDDEPVTGNTYSWTPTTGALTFTKQDHYKFNGISDVVGATPSGSELSYTLSKPIANVTLTATWQRLFTLQYNSKGGAAVSSVVDVVKNTPVETSPSPKLTGYNLVGWYNNEGYTGDAVTFPYAITKDETLFAKWEVKTTEITLSQTDATTKGTEKVIATWGQPMPTTDVTMPQREHYQFAGYKHSSTLYYKADGTSAKDWDKEDAEATLTAQWEINKHNIKLPTVLAGGTLDVSTGTSNVSYDATVTITPHPNDHYTLTALSWNGHDILSSKSFQMPDEDVTIAATFTEDPKRTISWSVGGSIAATTNDIYDGTAFATLKANAPAVADNAAGDCADKFMGWAIAPINTQGGIDKDAVQWADEATTSETQNTFYAVFAKGTEGGSGSKSKSWSFGNSTDRSEWTASSTTDYFSTYYGFKNSNATIKKYDIEDFKNYAASATNITIGVTSFQHTTTGTDLTIILVDKNGNEIGTGKDITPATGTATSAATEQTVSFGATDGATGYKIKCKSFNKNALVSASRYEISYKTITYGNYITQCCQAPENPLEITNTNLTVKTNGTLELNTTEGNSNTKTWESKNTAVATVDQNGLVTPVGTGKATITVSQEANTVKVEDKDVDFCEQYAEVEIEVIAANEFSIAFAAADGGTTEAKVNGAPTNKATTYTTVTITATPDDDYNFIGWTVNAGGVILGDASAPTTTFTMGEADVEITPSFAKKQFTITLNAGNGTIEGGSTKKLENQNIHSTITLPDAVACNSDEWEFKGWAIESVEETTTEPTFVSTQYEVTDNATLYAVYGQTTTVDGDYKYKIYAKLSDTDKRYLKGEPKISGGTKVNTIEVGTETDAQTYTLVTIDASANKYALKYTADATAKYLYINKESSNYYLQSTTSLENTAYWEKSTGTNGSVRLKNVQYSDYGIIYRYMEASTTYNYVRAYKTSNVTAAGTQYYDLELQLVGREQTTGGVWNSNPSCAHHYQVTYDGNGTTTTCTSEKLEEGEITLCADEPSLAGYTFGGWSDGTNTYAAGAKYNLTAPVTFTAVWNPIKVTAITLNVTEPQTLNWKSDLASAPTFQLSVASTTPAAVADNSVTWSVSEGTAVSVSATGLVTAVEAGTATIKATANDGSGVTASCTFTVTKTYKLTITDTEGVYNIKANESTKKEQYFEVNTPITLTKSVSKGYIFGEWVVKQGETPITVTDDKFTMPAAEVTVTATFTTKKDYYVDDMNDNAQIVMEGKYTVPSLPDVVTPSSSNSCEQTHLYFVGWIETEISSGQTEVPSGLITAGTEKTAGEKTYHAVWAEDANNNQ